MNYHVDKDEQLANAQKLARFGSVASLKAQGAKAKQHNVGVETTAPKKSAAKKSAAPKKSTAKKTAKKS